MSDFGFYFSIGWEHILHAGAWDHILFIIILASVYLPRDWKQVLVLVTAFTLGHGLTLALASLRIIDVNADWVEFGVACTIIITAIVHLSPKAGTLRLTRINYVLALFFGLIHGLAFAQTLRMLLATDQNFALSMLGFSTGLETGQVLIVVLILFVAHFVVHILKVPRREWVIFLSAAVMALALEMAVQRWPVRKNHGNVSKPYQRSFPNITGYRSPVTHGSFIHEYAHHKKTHTYEEGFPVFRSSDSNEFRAGARHQKQSGLQPRQQV